MRSKLKKLTKEGSNFSVSFIIFSDRKRRVFVRDKGVRFRQIPIYDIQGGDFREKAEQPMALSIRVVRRRFGFA